MEVKVLGKGCPKCKRLEVMTREVLAETGTEATFSKVTDVDEILAYDVISTPGLVINEKVLFSGGLPTKQELREMIRQWLSSSRAWQG